MNWRWSNFPIPVEHLGGLILGLAMHFFRPDGMFPDSRIGLVIGAPLILGGLFLAAWATRQAGEMNIESPTTLITGGPYSWSRNPMYVGWSMMYLGISLAVNSLWLLILFPAVVVLMHLLSVRGEERFLEEQFGDEYRKYREKVRRYL